MQNWVTTKEAERILGIKRVTLKRNYANPNTGFLIEGTHWNYKINNNSSTKDKLKHNNFDYLCYRLL